MRYFIGVLLLFFSTILVAQKTYQGQVVDSENLTPLAFSKVTADGKTVLTDWEGRFSIQIENDKTPIFFSYKGYKDFKYTIYQATNFLLIKLEFDYLQKDVEIYSEKRVNSIVKKVIENISKNDPEKAFKSFEYKNYDHLLVTANPKLISAKIETIKKRNIFGQTIIKKDSGNYKFQKIVEKQHLYQTEKVNLIQHNKNKNKETIIAVRMAGFKQPLYEYLGLKLISYSVYENPFKILEIPVQNPISNFGRRLYSFKLIDSLKIENRKVYRIYFQPKRLKESSLRGLLYIDSENFGIAKALYKMYGKATISAVYNFDYLKEYKIWFPEKKTFKVTKGNSDEDLRILGGVIKFSSYTNQRKQNDATDQSYLLIESKPFDIKINKPTFIIEPRIKIDVPKNSFQQKDSYWKTFAKDTIDPRKLNTYNTIDSLSVAGNYEKKVILGKKIINGYFPINFIDVDLRSIVKYNNFEGFRFGIGGVTNNKLSEKYNIGFFGAYGLKDKAFKFGINPAYLLDKMTNSWVDISYSDDLSEIGQIQFATQNKRFRIYDPRPINVSTFYENKTISASLESRLIPKTEVYFGLIRSEINPLFDYTYVTSGVNYTTYKIATAQLAVQWNPFSHYMQTPIGRVEIEKHFPKFTFQITKSLPNFFDSGFDFTKVDFKIEHDISYLSGQKTAFLFQTGLGFGEIPLTHLYSIAPNNLDKKTLFSRITFAGKNSFETMYYNEFFSNQYFMFQAKHSFNKIRIRNKLNPTLTAVTRFAYGSLDKPQNHQGTLKPKTLENGFMESGIEVNKIYSGFGLNLFFRHGANSLPRLQDNLALKISFQLDLGL